MTLVRNDSVRALFLGRGRKTTYLRKKMVMENLKERLPISIVAEKM